MFVINNPSHLLKLLQVYDGVRRRALPVLFDALKPGTDDDRMKGALWTLDLASFGKYAIAGKSEFIHGLNLSDIQDRTFFCQ
jgi:proteasome activator subunit 4